MRAFRIVAVLYLSVGLYVHAQTNQAPLKDAQAMQIVNRAVQALGGIAALNSIKDLVEGGDIRFNWGTQEVHGSAFAFGEDVGVKLSWQITNESTAQGSAVSIATHPRKQQQREGRAPTLWSVQEKATARGTE